MLIQQIENDFKNFKYHFSKLMECEERCAEVVDNLRYGSVRSPSLSTPMGSSVCTNNKIIQLIHEEDEITKERDYHLYAVKKVAKWLTVLNDDEVELLELRYWFNYSIKVCASMTYHSKRTISRKLYAIYEKIQKQAFK